MWGNCFSGFGGFRGFFGYGGWYGLIGMILQIALVVGAIYLMIRLLSGIFVPKGGHDNRAIALLKEQYARGEISKEEYQERKGILEN